MISVGLVGYGLAGRVFHAPLIAATSSLQLTAIATRSHASAAHSAYPSARLGSVQEIIAATDIDLVVVATPNDSHTELTLQALDAGKSVVVDKPMANSLADAQRMADRAAQRRLTLAVFHNRRWDDDYLTLRGLFESGALGEWTGYESRFDRFRPVVPDRWRERPAPGAGIWWDLGPHLVDQTLQLFGWPDAVTADLAMQRAGAQVPDYAQVILHYGQRRAVLHASCLEPAPGYRLRLQGTRAAFGSHGLDPQEAWLNSDRAQSPARRYGELARIDDNGVQAQRQLLQSGDYTQFYRRLADCLLSAAEVPVRLESALQTMSILDIAEQSAQRHCTIFTRG